MSFQALAFFTGLIGSLHCAAMCGPLVMVLPVTAKTWYYELLQRVLYQAGRIATYSLLGFIVGFIGSGFSFLGWQQALSFITGLVFIIIALQYFTKFKSTQFNKLQLKIVVPVATAMGKWLNNPYGSFFAGSLHGFLPCGMLYIALLSSLNAGSPINGSTFMLFFGLGTTPFLLLASVASSFIRSLKMKKYIIPVMYLVAGCFLITRGLNLNVPYVSASVSSDGEITICR